MQQIKELLEQLEKCNYECEAGYLSNNTAFIALKEISQQEVVEQSDADSETCESCSKNFNIEVMESDADSNWFCPECWKELAPIMQAEYEQLSDEATAEQWTNAHSSSVPDKQSEGLLYHSFLSGCKHIRQQQPNESLKNWFIQEIENLKKAHFQEVELLRQQPTGMQWVKASENKLPPNPDSLDIAIRYNFNGKVWDKEFGDRHTIFSLIENGWKDVEWLDESEG